MYISILHEADEVENELDIALCCASCAKSNMGWAEAQYNKVCEIVKSGNPIIVPDSVKDKNTFCLYVKNTNVGEIK